MRYVGARVDRRSRAAAATHRQGMRRRDGARCGGVLKRVQTPGRSLWCAGRGAHIVDWDRDIPRGWQQVEGRGSRDSQRRDWPLTFPRRRGGPGPDLQGDREEGRDGKRERRCARSFRFSTRRQTERARPASLEARTAETGRERAAGRSTARGERDRRLTWGRKSVESREADRRSLDVGTSA